MSDPPFRNLAAAALMMGAMISRDPLHRRGLTMSNEDPGPRPVPDIPPPPRRYPPGPCQVCGKPNVRAGRERGIYRCQAHMEISPRTLQNDV